MNFKLYIQRMSLVQVPLNNVNRHTAGVPQQPSLDAQMTNYYQLHAKIYDATRWTFLFGRRALLDYLPFGRTDKFTVAEIGCGTGFNLLGLRERFPKAKLIGIDVAKPMLDIAKKKCQNMGKYLILKELAYSTEGDVAAEKPNTVLFSYCLTMVNPDWEKLILQAKSDLPKDGHIAVVDFHETPLSIFRRWMRFNHVEMQGHILPFLQQHFLTIKVEKRKAYFGLWTYFLFVGKK
jgi:S-adenosylmethionine-diacylgycerolhomoserine-N-methlytransferase